MAIKQEKVKINTLYSMANEYLKNITSEDEIEKIDMTDIFYKEIEMMIKEGELIDININGKVRLGKSTEAMALGKHIFELLKKYKIVKNQRLKFNMDNIARDHQEYSKKMRDPNTQFTVIVTDESNELENTGENVTAEQALNKVFSDVQAGRYVHRICCSPKEVLDNNADIMLEIIGIDRASKISHNRLYYRMFRNGTNVNQLLGYVSV